MKSPKAAKLVRIYIKENDRYKGKPLYVALTFFLKEKDIRVVTVVRGRIVFGREGILHGKHFWPIPGDFPIILEFLDEAERIEAVLPEILRMLTRGRCVVSEGQMWG